MKVWVLLYDVDVGQRLESIHASIASAEAERDKIILSSQFKYLAEFDIEEFEVQD